MDERANRRPRARGEGAKPDAKPDARDPRELVARLRRGDPRAVASVRTRVRRILRHKGFGMGPEDREDLEQEVMAQVWQGVNRREFRVGGSFWGFVDVIAGRRSIDWLRVRRETLSLDESAAELQSPRRGPLQTVLSTEEARLALSALKGLDRPCRELVFLRVGLAKSYREIAVLTGHSEGALRTRFCRCIQSARERIEGERGVAAALGKDVER